MTQFWSFEKPVVTTGTGTAYLLDLPSFSAYTDFAMLVNFHIDCDAGATIEINNFWAKALVDSAGVSVEAMAIKADDTLNIMFDVSKDCFEIIGSLWGWTRGWGGVWSKTSLVDGQIYQAGPMGWILVCSNAVGFGSYNDMTVYSDASATPTTVVGHLRAGWYGSSGSQDLPFTTPILPNMYYQTSWANDYIYFYEIGTGGWATEKLQGYSLFDGTMNGTSPVIISDARIGLTTPFNVYFASQPAGNITRTLWLWTLTITSDNAADIMDFRVVMFGFGVNETYVVSDTQTITGAWPRVINDARISADTPVDVFLVNTPVGFLTAEAGAGTVTISSSATESNLQIKYIAYTSPAQLAIVDQAYGPSWSWDMNGRSADSIYDKIESMGSSLVPVADVITFTRASSAVSGTTTYNHWLWRVPKTINILWHYIDSWTVWWGSDWFYANWKNMCFYTWNVNPSQWRSITECVLVWPQWLSNSQSWHITNLTATTFDIVWTNNGSSAWNDYYFICNLVW
jgi:hypothetical protein